MRLASLFFACVVLATACDSAAATTTSTSASRPEGVLPVVALPGYQVSMFTQTDSRLVVSNPDSIAVDGQNVFIDYQNVTAKDCSDQGKPGSPATQ